MGGCGGAGVLGYLWEGCGFEGRVNQKDLKRREVGGASKKEEVCVCA